MNLSNFEQYTSSAIVQRGKAYYKNGYVGDLEELDSGKWSAEVDGNDIYTVNVELNGQEIIDGDCDCPYDDYPCKHLVAVWYALADKQKISSSSSEVKHKKNVFKELLAQLALSDYQAFVKDYSGRNRDFKMDFELYFASKVADVDV